METLVPVHLSQITSANSLSATHHHHHIHQHLYPNVGSCNDTSTWFHPTDYPSPTASYRPYSSYPNNTFYDQPQWSTPTSSLPMKFDVPYSPPSYEDSSQNLDQTVSDSKDEPSDGLDQSSDWYKAQLIPVPPKNLANGTSSRQ